MSVQFAPQNLGVFTKDFSAIQRCFSEDNCGRTQVDRYTILDLKSDPVFPVSGSFKKIYYCVSKSLGSGEFRIFVAARASVECSAFYREMQILRVLDGVRNVFQPLLIQRKGAFQYMISSLCKWGDLYHFIDTPGRNLQAFDSYWLGYQIVSAVLNCHISGIIHRDLKPENILVEKKRRGFEAKLIDFGLSYCRQQEDEEDDDQSKGAVGTYVSPEVIESIRKGEEIDSSDYLYDHWPLGLILYVLVKGNLPEDYRCSSKKELYSVAFDRKSNESLGIYGEVIRHLLFPESECRSLESIRKSMIEALQKQFPNKKAVQKEFKIRQAEASMEEFLLSMHEEVSEVKTVWQRFCSWIV